VSARKPREAYDRYAAPLKQALSCITGAHVQNRGGYDTSRYPSRFGFTHNPARLGDPDLALFFEEEFYIVEVENEPGTWKAITSKYEYAIEEHASRQEIFAFHWGRNLLAPVPYPHLHIGFGTKSASPPVGPKVHVPTGRVAVEDIVFFLISELDVPPVPEHKHDWKEVLLPVVTSSETPVMGRF
jgi:hypothetical protein